MCLDYGKARIGVAFSDLSSTIATADHIYKTRSRAQDLQYFSDLIQTKNVDLVVFGLPLNADGTESEMCLVVKDFATELQNKTNVEIAFQDERYTSFEAEEYLKEAGIKWEKRKELLDKVSARYYEIAPTSSEYTGYTESITCNEFFNAINDNISDPVAILGSINSPDTQQTSDNNSAYTAGQTPISGETSVETMGLAVFSHDKLVGELNGLESICHLIISSKLENAQIRIPSPIEQLDYIDLYIELDKNTKNSLYLVNSSPYITSNIKLTAIIQSLNSDIDLDDEKVVDRIEDYAEKYLKYHLYNYLYKTSKEFNSDIDNFGLYALKYFNKMSDLEEYNWNHHYKDAFFNVNVNVELRSSYLLVNTSKEEE